MSHDRNNKNCPLHGVPLSTGGVEHPLTWMVDCACPPAAAQSELDNCLKFNAALHTEVYDSQKKQAAVTAERDALQTELAAVRAELAATNESHDTWLYKCRSAENEVARLKAIIGNNALSIDGSNSDGLYYTEHTND